MSPLVLGQVVGAHEASAANLASKLFLAGVRALVPGELVRARKRPAAVLPLAPEGFFSGVRAHVRLQVRRLEVVFAAALEIALEDAAPGVRLLFGRRDGGGGGRAGGQQHEGAGVEHQTHRRLAFRGGEDQGGGLLQVRFRGDGHRVANTQGAGGGHGDGGVRRCKGGQWHFGQDALLQRQFVQRRFADAAWLFFGLLGQIFGRHVSTRAVLVRPHDHWHAHWTHRSWALRWSGARQQLKQKRQNKLIIAVNHTQADSR